MRRPRAYLILSALALIFVLLVLALALFHSGSVAGGLVAMSHRRLVEDSLLESTLARLGLLMEGRTPPGPRDLALDGQFQVGQDRYRARVTWQEGAGSVRLPQPAGCATGPAVLPEPGKPGLPPVGYDTRLLKTAAGSVPVAPGHAAVAFDFSDSDRYVAVYSNAFPFAAYAPRGSIRVGKVGAFANPTFRAMREDPKPPLYTGVPVWMAARGEVTATKFPHGKAWSQAGPLNVPGGALALRETLPEDARAARLSRDVLAAFSALSAGSLDKTPALVGHVLTPQGMWRLLTGEGRVGDILSLQQATMLPFIPVPGISKVPPVFVLHLHHPWPPDFSRPDPGPGPRARLEALSKELDEVFQQRQKLRKEVQDLRDELGRLGPKDPRRPQLEKDLKAKEKAANEAYRRWNDLNAEVQAVARQLREGTWEHGRVLAGVPPDDAIQESKYRTLGWSYFYVVEAAVDLLVKLVETGSFEVIFEVLATPTRMVHLGGENPEFYFPDGLPRRTDTREVRRPGDVPLGTLSTKGTLTVPQGRTLRITHDLQVRGDLWIQRGASFYVQGSLTVPRGRVLLEEGASLLVEGDLRCSGGTPVTGSVTVAAPYDEVHPLTSAILCKGNVFLDKGVSQGVTMTDLVGYARTENASFGPAHDFLRTYDWLAPQIAKVLGPFEPRTNWFADYATTVVFVPIKGIPIPVPLPLPQANCLKGLFDVLSPFYALQLNARLGPNLYPQSLLWIYGRGVVPIFPRSDPRLAVEKLSGLVGSIPELSKEVVLTLLPEFLKETVGEVAQAVVLKALVLAVNSIVSNVLPFNPVPCSPLDSAKQPRALRQIVDTVIGKVAAKLLESFLAVVIVTRDSLVGEIGKDPAALAREAPGLFLYTDKSLYLGATRGDAPVAAGLFVARGDVSCRAERTFGALISLEGSIQAEDLYYYPYFTWASLYNPMKPGQMPDLGPLTPNAELRDLFFFEVPRGPAPARDVSWNGWRVVGRGWVRP